MSDASLPGLWTESSGQESSSGSPRSGDCSGDLSDRDTSVDSFPSSIGHMIHSPPTSPSSTPAHAPSVPHNDESTPSTQGSTTPMPSPTSGGSIFGQSPPTPTTQTSFVARLVPQSTPDQDTTHTHSPGLPTRNLTTTFDEMAQVGYGDEGEVPAGFTLVDSRKKKRPQEDTTTEQMPSATVTDFLYITFSLLSKRFICQSLMSQICNEFYVHMGSKCDTKTDNRSVTFKVASHFIGKAKSFLSRSTKLPSLKLVNQDSPRQQNEVNKPTNQKPSNKPSFSKGIMFTNGATENQIRDMFNFEVNNMTNFQPITNKWGKNMGKAIITFSTPEPPFYVRSGINVKEIHPLQSRPVRCNNCQELGHKDFKCRNKARCMNCSDPHMTKNCRKDFRYTRFVCFNCNDNHTANHPMCPAWNQYKHSIEVKNQATLNDWGQRKKAHMASLNRPNTPVIPTKANDLSTACTYAQSVTAPQGGLSTPEPKNLPPAQPQQGKPASPAKISIPEHLVGQAPEKRTVISAAQVAKILKYILQPSNLKALQAMGNQDRDVFLDPRPLLRYT